MNEIIAQLKPMVNELVVLGVTALITAMLGTVRARLQENAATNKIGGVILNRLDNGELAESITNTIPATIDEVQRINVIRKAKGKDEALKEIQRKSRSILKSWGMAWVKKNL